MPQITVDYSAELDDTFDRPGFADALHPLIAEKVTTKTAACKTRFRRVEETVVADAPGGDALVHVDISLLPGRTPKSRPGSRNRYWNCWQATSGRPPG